MTKAEHDRQSVYFQNGYHEGSSGWECNPTNNGKKLNAGSYAHTEYIKGHDAGKADS